jgi:ribonuclease P protein component
MNNTFSKSLRVRTTAEYKRVFDARLRIQSRYFILYHIANNQQHSRIGIITSRKNLRFAVWRNRFRRLARETFRLNTVRQAGKDIVLVGKNNIAQASDAELVYCLKKLFAKLEN